MPKDATGLPRGDSRSLLQKPELLAQRCHGLAPWRFTLAATKARVVGLKMPRACPVEIHARCYTGPWHLWTQQWRLWDSTTRPCVAASVNLHWTSPWHPLGVFTQECLVL